MMTRESMTSVIALGPSALGDAAGEPAGVVAAVTPRRVLDGGHAQRRRGDGLGLFATKRRGAVRD